VAPQRLSAPADPSGGRAAADADAAFEFGLDLILIGLEAKLRH